MNVTAARTMSVELDPDICARLEQMAQSRRRSPHWILREAVAHYVEREEKRDVFRQDTIKVREQFQSSGLHATADEADAWLAQRSEGNDIELPECKG